MSIGMELRFEVLDDASGVFAYPEERFDGLVEEFDELLDAHQSGGSRTSPT
jgi:hypothetical protein